MFEDLDSELTNYSHIIGMDKVSGFFSVTVAIAVVYIVIAVIGKVLKKNLKTEIVSAKYDDVGSGAFDYSRSPRLGYGQNNQGAQGYGNPPQPNPPQYAQPPYGQPGYNQPNQPSYNQPYGTQSAQSDRTVNRRTTSRMLRLCPSQQISIVLNCSYLNCNPDIVFASCLL